MTRKTKNMTLRLPVESAQRLEFIASAEGTNMSDLIRTAIDEYLDGKRRDPASNVRLRESVSQVARWLEEAEQDDDVADPADGGSA